MKPSRKERIQAIRGARLRVGLLVLAMLTTLFAPARSATLVGRGDFSLYVETFSQAGADGDSRLLLIAQLPAEELSWREAGDSLAARLNCAWSLHALGEECASVEEELRLRRPPGSGGSSILYIRSLDLPAGEYRLEMRCEDLQRKVGGVFGFLGHHPEATLSDLVRLRDFTPGGTLTDLLFHSVDADGGSTRLNPGGLFMPGEGAMEVSAEFVPPPAVDPDAERFFGLRLRILDDDGNQHFEKKGGWKYERDPMPLRFRLPMAGLSTGDYTLEMSLHGPKLEPRVFSRRFTILRTLKLDDEVLARRAIEAQLFLDTPTYENWLATPPRERMLMMERFWLRHDADPSTEENEIYTEFLHRYELAQSRYTVFEPGALSDRGRMLIRFGDPEDIQSEVMPLNRTELSNALRDLHGEQALEPGISPFGRDQAGNEEDVRRESELGRDMGRIGTGTALNFGQDSEAFEVWSYEMGGKPLLPEHRLHLHGVGLKVIFTDTHGYGDYRLVYRSEDFDF